MLYQYKREPLSDDEVNQLTNACKDYSIISSKFEKLTSRWGVGK